MVGENTLQFVPVVLLRLEFFSCNCWFYLKIPWQVIKILTLAKNTCRTIATVITVDQFNLQEFKFLQYNVMLA